MKIETIILSLHLIKGKRVVASGAIHGFFCYHKKGVRAWAAPMQGVLYVSRFLIHIGTAALAILGWCWAQPFITTGKAH